MGNAKPIGLQHFAEKLKPKILEEYMSSMGKTPVYLSKTYRVPVITINEWVREEGWAIQRADAFADRTTTILDEIGLIHRDEIPTKVGKNIKALVEAMSTLQPAKIEVGNLDTIKKITDIYTRLLDIDERIVERLGL